MIVTVGPKDDPFQVLLRPATPDDEAVIMKAWLVGFREMGDWPPRVPSEIYFREHRQVVMRLLAKFETTVACNPERETQVFGFITAGRYRELHWVYVKEMYRRNGIGTALWRAAGTPSLCSHWTRVMEETMREKWGLYYDPFALEVGK